MAEPGPGPSLGPFGGTIISVAPAAMELPMLLRIAIDAEQIGVTRLELPYEIDDPEPVVAALREHTNLIITAMAESSSARFVDLAGHFGPKDKLGWIPIRYRAPRTMESRLVELNISEMTELSAMTTMIALGIGTYPSPVSLSALGASRTLASLAALAAGGHVRVGTQLTDGEPRENLALAAKAGGIARLAGRPPLNVRQARADRTELTRHLPR